MRSSIVRYEMQRVASTVPGATMAPVGHADRHAVHSPHWSKPGSSGSSGRLVMRHPRNSHEPSSGLITQLFLPIQPMPACCAYTRSWIGPVSTYARASNGASFSRRIHSARASRRWRTMTW